MKRCQSITLTRGLHRGQIGWLLRWRERTPDRTHPGLLLSYWFVDEQEAKTVRDAMMAGAGFDDAFRLVWNA